MKILKNKLILIKEDEIDYSNKIKNSQDIYKFITEIIKPSQEPEEVLYVVVLTNSNHIQAFMEVARGTSNKCCVNFSDIFKRVILTNCKKYILVHNHPSGIAKPSNIDYLLTEQIKEASKIIGLELLDHIVVGDNTFKSCMK